MIKKKIGNIAVGIALLLGTLLILFPMYLTVITSFKTQKETAQNFFGFPKELYLGNFIEVITENDFFVYVGNSVIITLCSLLLIVVVVPLVSYAITRNMHKLYYKIIYGMFSLGIFIPFQVIMLPIVKQMTNFSALNKYGLMTLYLTYSLAQGVFLYVGYIRNNMPAELEEAAYIDGASKIKTYILVVFPMLKPMTATIIITNALWIWNDFLLPLLMLNKSSKFWTLPLFQYNFQSTYAVEYNLAFASFVLTIVPILIVYLVFQKHILAGMTNGAVKG